MNVTPGPWLMLSVYIVRMKQSLSAIFAVCGSSSLSQAPLSPY